MSNETVLTDFQIFDCFDRQCAEMVINFDAEELYPVGRAIEQAVLQSEQVRAWKRDAELYGELRKMHWTDSPMCVVRNPKASVKLGSDCPSGERLDVAIRAAMEKQS